MAKSDEQLLIEELESLSPEELDLYEQQMMQRAEVQEMDMPRTQKQYAPSVEEMDQARAAVQPTTGEALSAGFVEGVPFSKDVVATYDAMSEEMEDGASASDIYDKYKRNLNEIDRDLNAAEENAPGAFMAGDVAGTLGSIAVGGAALKSTQAGAALTGTGVTMASATGVGAASQLSRSEDRSVTDPVVGAAIGLGSEIGGRYIAKGLKKTGSYIMDRSESMVHNAAKKRLGFKNVSGQKKLKKHLARTGQTEDGFFKNIFNQKMKSGGEDVVDFTDSPKRMLEKIDVKLKSTGQSLESNFAKADAKYKVEVDINKFKNALKTKLLPRYKDSMNPDHQKIGVSLESYIDDIGKTAKSTKSEMTPDGPKMITEYGYSEKVNLTDIWSFQKDIREGIKSYYNSVGNPDLASMKRTRSAVASEVGELIDDVLRTVDDAGDTKLLNNIKKDRLNYGNLSKISKAMETVSDDTMSPMREFFSTRNAMNMFMTSASGLPIAAAAPLAFTFTKAMNNPKTPTYIAKGLGKLGAAMEAAPRGKMATSLLTSAGISEQAFQDTLYENVARINLTTNPIPRSLNEVKTRMEDIKHYLKNNEPQILNSIEQAIEEEDDSALAGIVSGLSATPNGRKFFEEGIGFDGKVYTEGDKATLERQLKGSDLPAAQRIEMLENLRANGIVPNLDDAVEPQPIQHQPRTKKMPNY